MIEVKPLIFEDDTFFIEPTECGGFQGFIDRIMPVKCGPIRPTQKEAEQDLINVKAHSLKLKRDYENRVGKRIYVELVVVP